MEKRRPKNFKDPIEVRIAFFGFETIRWRLIAVKAVELTESFVLTGYGSRNSKRDNSYGHPKNRYPQGATFAVQDATFGQKAETAPFDFEKWVQGFEVEQYHAEPLSREGKSKTSNGDAVLT